MDWPKVIEESVSVAKSFTGLVTRLAPYLPVFLFLLTALTWWCLWYGLISLSAEITQLIPVLFLASTVIFVLQCGVFIFNLIRRSWQNFAEGSRAVQEYLGSQEDDKLLLAVALFQDTQEFSSLALGHRVTRMHSKKILGPATPRVFTQGTPAYKIHPKVWKYLKEHRNDYIPLLNEHGIQ